MYNAVFSVASSDPRPDIAAAVYCTLRNKVQTRAVQPHKATCPFAVYTALAAGVAVLQPESGVIWIPTGRRNVFVFMLIRFVFGHDASHGDGWSHLNVGSD